MDYKKRQNALIEILSGKGLDSAVILCPENVFYLTGAPFVTGSADTLLYLDRDRGASLIVWNRDYEETKDRVKGVNIEKLEVGEKPIDRLKKLAVQSERAGFEEGFVNIGIHNSFKAIFDLVPLEGAIGKMREVKDADEIACIEKAQGVTDRAFSKALGRFSEGMTEQEAASELEYYLRREGAESYAFETIVGSGHRAVYPHGMPSKKKAIGGEAVVFDFGAKVDGYCSDMTRTIFFGKPNGEIVNIYEAVLEAQTAALAAAKAGIAGKELDAVARNILNARGYGKYFVHGLGHGVGIAIHEGPSVSSKSEDVFVPGNVITDEPGVYLPRVGGVRIEDMILITDNGCRNLTKSKKDLTVV
jgi:Xaa-Pro aminopeptidase